ncbi:MAG TPA: hypothetical protein VFT22_22495 [Kofleriaceae bacterium]|nr:hypothetical protein [Kofleriaceae bacterium]
MRPYLACVVVFAALTGCSLLYNPNNLSNVPGEASVDAEVILDADPRMLVLDDVAPSTIYEGQGDLGSAPQLVVVHGHHIIDNNTTIEITPTSGARKLEIGAPVIAKNGNWIAVPVIARVDTGLLKSDVVSLDIKVTQALPDGSGAATFTLHDKLTLQGLAELTDTSGAINTGSLEPQYSKIDLSAATTTFTGANPAILRTTSSITAKALVANGTNGDAKDGAAMMMTLGGCGGGGPGTTGGCNGTIGGRGGMLASLLSAAGGGGGGGFAEAGKSGSGQSAGAGGSPNGDELIAAYSSNQAAGGGGGGATTLLGAGGVGGSGGGTVELSAAGDISVGAISANGGNGASSSSGGGGGGAGGVVMLRADGSLKVSAAPSVTGGMGASGGGNANGGNGSPGRVRWDAPSGVGITAIAAGTLHRGPAFTLTERLFRDSIVNISLRGTANDTLSVYAVNGGKTYNGTRTDVGDTVTIGPDGTLVFRQVLEQGLSHLCVTVAGGKLGTSEADKCVDVAFLP